MKSCGKGWVIIETRYHENVTTLLSILPPRKTPAYVEEYLLQLYIDRNASIQGKINFKKKPSEWPSRVQYDPLYKYFMWCGHDPIYEAIYCDKLSLAGSILIYTHRVFLGADEPLKPKFKTVTKEIQCT